MLVGTRMCSGTASCQRLQTDSIHARVPLRDKHPCILPTFTSASCSRASSPPQPAAPSPAASCSQQQTRWSWWSAWTAWPQRSSPQPAVGTKEDQATPMSMPEVTWGQSTAESKVIFVLGPGGWDSGDKRPDSEDSAAQVSNHYPTFTAPSQHSNHGRKDAFCLCDLCLGSAPGPARHSAGQPRSPAQERPQLRQDRHRAAKEGQGWRRWPQEEIRCLLHQCAQLLLPGCCQQEAGVPQEAHALTDAPPTCIPPSPTLSTFPRPRRTLGVHPTRTARGTS